MNKQVDRCDRCGQFVPLGELVVVDEDAMTCVCRKCDKPENVIIRFTNRFGEVNHGVVVDTEPGGMVCVQWDEFTALLARLDKRGRVSEFVRRGLSVRRSWVRVETPLPNGAMMELLPGETMPVMPDVVIPKHVQHSHVYDT